MNNCTSRLVKVCRASVRRWVLLLGVLAVCQPSAVVAQLILNTGVPGSGNVVGISGTPTAGQLAEWVDQTTVRGTNALSIQVTTLDVTGATRTAPNKVGTTPPGTCTLGDTFVNSTTPAAPTLGLCNDANVFTPLGGGSSSFTSPVTITSTSSQALAVGPNGATAPALTVHAGVASAVGGLEVKGNADGAGATLTATGTGANQTLTVFAKGSANLLVGPTGSAGAFLVTHNNGASTRLIISATGAGFTPGVRTGGSTAAFSFVGGADTTLAAGTEAKDVFFNLGQTKQHAGNTAIALQRHFHIDPPTDTCATATCTITEDALLALSGPPTGGTNSLITRASTLLIETRTLTNVTNGYGMIVDAPSGASTLNAAAYFRSGPVLIEDLKTSAAGAGKRVVCVDPATGRLFVSATSTDCS